MEFYLYKRLRVATGSDAYHMQSYRHGKGWPSVAVSQGGSVGSLLRSYVSAGMWHSGDAPAELSIEQATAVVQRFTDNALKVLDATRGVMSDATIDTRRVTGDMFDNLFEDTGEDG